MKGQELKRRLARADATQAELAAFMSHRLGRPVAIKNISRIVTGERLRLSVEEAAAIEEFFELRAAGVALAPERPIGGTLAPRIPLYGLAVAGDAQNAIAFNNDSVIQWIDAPIANVDAAFRIAGDAMEPRLYAGETAFVKLGVPPRRLDDVVAELKDGRVLIRTFDKIEKGFIFLRQWNPAQELRLPYDSVRALHAVRLRA